MNLNAEAALMIRDAREHILKKGWTKGTTRNGRGEVCLLQALADVDGQKHGKPVDDEVKRIIYKHIGTTSIPSWNDHRDRTMQDVITILEACEKMEQELAC